MLDGRVIILVPIVKANVSEALSVSDAKFETVTTWPEIAHDDEENPDKFDSVQVPEANENSEGKVTTILALDPGINAVAACKERVKSTACKTVVPDALNVGLTTSVNVPAVVVNVIPVLCAE